MLFAKEILNFSQLKHITVPKRADFYKKSVLDTIQKYIFIDVAERAYYEMVS